MSSFQHFSKCREFFYNFSNHKYSLHDLQQRLDYFYLLDTAVQQYELDLYHLILKHARSCEICDPTPLLQNFFVQVVSTPSYSTLVCLLDIVKNTTLDDSVCQHWFTLTAPLWRHETIYTCRKSLQLCKRMVPQLDPSILASQLISYIQYCRQHLTPDIANQWLVPEYTEFFNDNTAIDRECVKLVVHIVLDYYLHHPLHPALNDLVEEITSSLDDPIQILFNICCINDDDTIQLLDTLLTLHISQSHIALPSPHVLFLYFLQTCGNTHDIIIDLLLENDSNFLSFFHRYVVYATHHIEELKTVMDESLTNILENTIRVLEKEGFPYNTKPLLRRLIQLRNKLLE